MSTIKFGTDGWRDRMDELFTTENVAIVAQAYINYYADLGTAHKGFFVGYDNRENSENFAQTVAQVISGNGFTVKLATEPCPTQVVSFVVSSQKLCSGVMITASHNPPEYNGFKIKEPQGCSSFAETTDKITAYLGKTAPKQSAENVELYNPKPAYFEYIKERIDFNLIKKSGLKIFINPLFGSGAGYLPELLSVAGIESIEINNQRDINFGGFNPEPLEYNVPDFIELMKAQANDFSVGLILDGDADRNGACGTNGDFLNSQKVFSVLFHHFAENLKKPGKLVHAFNGTKLLDKLAEQLGRAVVVTKIGFKYIAEEIIAGGVLIGGEESGGYAASGNIPDRDGILNSLYLCEVMATEQKSLDEIYADLETRFGSYCYNRLDLHLENRLKDKVISTLLNQTPVTLLGKQVATSETLDGIKLHFSDDSWILFRASGTEPLLRIYCEAKDNIEVAQMLSQAKVFAETI